MLPSLIAASVRFRFLLIAVAGGIIALAVAALPGMHSDVLPEMAPVTVRIQTETPGLSAPEVESLVTVPLEKNLLEGVMGVTDVTSDSIPGLSQIELHFAPGTSLFQARQLVQERLTQAFVLPNVSKPPALLPPVSSTGNVMLIGLTSRQLSLIDLSVLARWTIVPRLLGVPGVADVAAFGEADRQLQVLVDPARLAAHHITLAQIIETAGNAQLVSPLSFLEGSTPGTGGFLEGPNQRITIQPVLPFGTPANLGQIPGRAVSSDQIVSTNSAEIWVTIKPGAGYDSAVAQVHAIADGMPGVAGTVSTNESDGMNGVLAAAPGAVTVRLYGPGYGELARLGRQVEAVMSRLSGLGPPQMRLPVGQPTLNVAVNLTAATRNGVKPGDIRREAATLLSGLTVGNFFEQQKVFDVVVVGTPAVRSSLMSVSNLLLDTVNGGHARLGSLARVSVAAEPADITHDAMSPYVDVTARLSGRSPSSARAVVAAGLRGISFPLGYYAAVQGAPGTPAVSGARLASYVIAALIGILLLAQAATGSWRLALLVLAALPVPVAAAVLTAFALGTQDSLAAMAGLLGVLAVAIHQAFRVTAAIGRAHLADGGQLTPGLLVAAATDASGPAVTAAAVSAVALLPFIVMGDAAGNELLHAAAAVILAGLVAATLLNTLVLPGACLWFGPVRAPVGAGDTEQEGLPGAPSVPQPREEPEVPEVLNAAARPENPVR